MLSLPAVADVNVSSTDWDSNFVDHLETLEVGTDGYSIPVGSSDQLQTLPWINIDQIRITFSEDVDVQESDLSISGVNTTAYEFSDFEYDSNSYVATWTLEDPIDHDKLLIDLNGDGLDPVADVDEQNTLDGDWTDSSSTYNSGDGYGGGDFEFRFNVVGGDVDGSTGVNMGDALQVGVNIGKEAGDEGYNIRHDVDGDGEITWDDYYSTQGKLGDSLPSGNPAGVSNDAPSTSGISDVNVNEDAVDEVIQLFSRFDDAEDDDDDMTYEVVDNTNSSLFDSTDIDAYGGLTLDFADDAFGKAELTVRVTDTGGLFVETTFTVDVAPVNDAPVISDFGGSEGPGDFWTFSGTVTDVDDDVEGMIVTFGGVLESYGYTAIVQADGIFSLTKLFPGLQSGEATAQTEDDDQAQSNVALDWIKVT